MIRSISHQISKTVNKWINQPIPCLFFVDSNTIFTQDIEKQAQIEAKAEADARSASAAAMGERSDLGGLQVDIDQKAIQLAREVGSALLRRRTLILLFLVKGGV